MQRLNKNFWHRVYPWKTMASSRSKASSTNFECTAFPNHLKKQWISLYGIHLIWYII